MTLYVSTLGFATGASLMGVGLMTAAAGFTITCDTCSMMISTSAALFGIGDSKVKHIQKQKAQKEIREELRSKHGIQLA